MSLASPPRPAEHPTWPLVPCALFGLFTAAVILGVVLYGESERREMLGYLLLLVIGPFAGGLIWTLAENRRPGVWPRLASGLVLLSAITLTLIALGGILHQHGDQLQALTNRLFNYGMRVPLEDQLNWILPGFLALAMLLLALGVPRGLDRALRRSEPWAPPLLLAALILFCAIYSPLYRANDPRLSAFFGWVIEIPLFLPLLLVAWPAAWLLPRLPEVRRGPAAWGLLAVALLFTLLLYDDQSFIEWAHYTAYVGPALHALHGGVPMIEVYSQYGILPWALLTGAFRWLPETYGTAAMIVRLFTVLWYLAFVLTVYRLARDKTVALLLAAVGLLWSLSFMPEAINPGALPSTQGYRYLLPALAVLWLAWVPADRLRSPGLFILALIASLWSIEVALFVAGPALTLALLVALRERSPRRLICDGAGVLAGIAAGQALLLVWLQAAYGHWPDYGPILEGLGFFSTTEGRSAHWVEKMPYGFGLWVPVAGVLFATLAMTTRDALAGRTTYPRAWSLVPAAVLGIGELTYYVGRSYTTTLGLALLPFLVVALVGIDALLERWRTGRGAALQAERLLLALAIAACFAFAGERFVRPYDPGKSNATILRRCFTEAGCAPGTVARRIAAAAREKTVEIDTRDPKNLLVATNEFKARTTEAERLVQAHAADDERVGLLVDTVNYSFIGVPVLADLHKWFAWPISSPTNDGQTPNLARRIVAQAQPRDGEILIVAKARDELAAVVRPLAEKYAERCRLTRIDEGRFFEVLRTSDCKDR